MPFSFLGRTSQVFETWEVFNKPETNPPFITNKDTDWNTAQESIWRFIQQAQGTQAVAVWARSIQAQDPPTPNLELDIQTCDTQDPNYNEYEQAWPEAYWDTPYQNAYERSRFGTWWLRDEFAP